MCTTQVCTVASGQVIRIDSGRPFRPSQQTISASCEPAVLELGQHRRPLLGALTTGGPEPQAEDVALAVEVDADRDVDRAVSDLASRGP